MKIKIAVRTAAISSMSATTRVKLRHDNTPLIAQDYSFTGKPFSASARNDKAFGADQPTMFSFTAIPSTDQPCIPLSFFQTCGSRSIKSVGSIPSIPS